MGSGSSKRNLDQTLVVNAALNARGNRKKAEYLEEVMGEKNNKDCNLQSQETSTDENTVSDDKPNQSTEGTGVVEESKEVTVKLDDLPMEKITLLNSYCEKYPDMTMVLTSTASICHELRGSLESGNTITASSKDSNLANKLTSNYFKCKGRLKKTVLTNFTLNFEFPNLVCDIIRHLRTHFPELAKWDRAKKNLKQMERQEPQRSDGESEDKLEDDRAKGLKISQDIITALAAALLNFTDMHDEFCVMCSEAGMVTFLVEMVQELETAIEHNVKFVNPETQRLSKFTARGKMLSRLLGVLFNLSKRVPVRSKFVACDAVNVLIPLLKAEVTLFATKALLTLAYLIDEENNHLIMADEGPIKFLVSALNKSLKASNHRYLGFSSSELAEGLTQIAVNDRNKKTIVHCGAIPVVAKMLTAAKENQEKINGCNVLWTLAFDAENRREIKENRDILAELGNLVSQENVEVRKVAAGTLWEVELKEKHSEEKQPLAKGEGKTDSKHIMISYQWDVQSSMIQLKNRLQADGYKVWMDVDQMGGSTLESMAKAVEDACVVLIGVSQKYKESPNCRSEAEYTFQLHRDIIPLMMEKRYKPDGWLGLVVGAKFWIDFTDRHKLDSSIDMLKRELSNRETDKVQDTVTETKADTLDAAPVPSIQTWTSDAVKQWLVDLGLYSRMNPAAVKQMDGAMLVRLQDLRQESPEFFFSSVTKELRLPSLFDVLRFTDALKKLLG